MAKQIEFIRNVHLSENFGGVKKHGAETGDRKNGTTEEIESDKLADRLIELGLAKELKIAGKNEAKK